MKRIFITLFLSSLGLGLGTSAFAGPFHGTLPGGDVKYEQIDPEAGRFQVEGLVQQQGQLLLLQVLDLKSGQRFDVWATDAQLERGPGQSVFLSVDAVPPGA